STLPRRVRTSRLRALASPGIRLDPRRTQAEPPVLDALMTALDDLEVRPAAEVLQGRLRSAGLVGADPLFRELVLAQALARLDALGVRAPARFVDAALTARRSNTSGTGPEAPGRTDALLADNEDVLAHEAREGDKALRARRKEARRSLMALRKFFSSAD